MKISEDLRGRDHLIFGKALPELIWTCATALKGVVVVEVENEHQGRGHQGLARVLNFFSE